MQLYFYLDIINYKRGVIVNRESYKFINLNFAKNMFLKCVNDHVDRGYDTLYLVYSNHSKSFIYLSKLIKSEKE